eukprot:Lankesteria_metandrocarpae@DN5429_c0_g2_i1.p1
MRGSLSDLFRIMTNKWNSCATAASSSGSTRRVMRRPVMVASTRRSIMMSMLVAVAVMLCTQSVTALDLEKVTESAKNTLQDNMPTAVDLENAARSAKTALQAGLPNIANALSTDKPDRGTKDGDNKFHATVQWADDDSKMVLLFRTTSEDVPMRRAPVEVMMHFKTRPMLYSIKRFFTKVVLRATEPFDIIEMRQRLQTELSGFDDKVEVDSRIGDVTFHFHEVHRNGDGTVYAGMRDLEWFQVDKTRVYMETIRTQLDYARVTFVISTMMGSTYSSWVTFSENHADEDVLMAYRTEFPEFAIQDLDGRLPSAAAAFTLKTSIAECGVEGRQALRELWKIFPKDDRPAALFPNDRRFRSAVSAANEPYGTENCRRVPLVVEFDEDDIHPLRDSLKEKGEWNYPKFQVWNNMSAETQLRRNFGNMIMYKTVKSIQLDTASATRGSLDNSAWEKKVFRLWDGLRGTKVCEISPMDIRETLEKAPAAADDSPASAVSSVESSASVESVESSAPV